jgi:hypothetical protein
MDKKFIINQIEHSIKNMDDALTLHSQINQNRQLNESKQFAKGLVTGLGIANGINLDESKKYHDEISEKYSALYEVINSNLYDRLDEISKIEFTVSELRPIYGFCTPDIREKIKTKYTQCKFCGDLFLNEEIQSHLKSYDNDD